MILGGKANFIHILKIMLNIGSGNIFQGATGEFKS
jgi:hypothetical protein